METLYTIASILFICFLTGEAVAAYVIYKNRVRFAAVIRQVLGLDVIMARIGNHDRFATETLGRIERKINFIGRHTKFERDQLRAMGVLVDNESANLAGQERNVNIPNDGRVLPLRR